jgi:hypothetical protein
VIEQPDGIIITFGRDMINEQGGLLTFVRGFQRTMSDEDSYWMHKCRNRPQQEFDHIYIVICNRVRWRCFFGGYETHATTGVTMDGKLLDTPWPRIILAGPLIEAPEKIRMQGFQGFRYTQKLF